MRQTLIHLLNFMKTLFSFCVVAMLFITVAPPARAAERVTLDFFYENLDPYGIWREVGDYGYCWQPSDVEEDWRPYSDGRWVYTDAGWTWDSDEPFGWAVYHYGRWANVEDIGWIWVPDTEWGPAWVSWRRSPRYVGWAPLPPEAHFRLTIGFSSWVDDYYDIGPSSYCFVEGRNFGEHRLRSVFVDPRENITIINQTTNITNITYVDSHVHNEGPRYDLLSRESARPIGRYTLDRRQSFDGDARSVRPEHLRSRVQGDSLSVFAPPIAGRSTSAPKKLAAKVGKAEVNRGWRNAGSAAEIAELRGKLKGQSKTPDELPRQVKYERRQDESPAERMKKADPQPTPDGRRKPSDQPPMVNQDKPSQNDKPRVPDGSVRPGKSEQPRKAIAVEQPPKRPDVEKPGKNNTKGDDSPRRSEAKLAPVPGRTAPPERPPGNQNDGKGKMQESKRPPVADTPPSRIPGEKPKSDKAVQQRPPSPKRPEAMPEAKRPDPRQTPPAVQQSQPERGKSKMQDQKRPRVEDSPPSRIPGRKPQSDNAVTQRPPPPKRPEPAPAAKRPDPRPPASPAVQQAKPEKAKGKSKDSEEEKKKPGKEPK